MNNSLVFTFLGLDRPGLVERLADIVADHQGNWLESRMTQLAGQFAGIARVTVPASEVDELSNALLSLNIEGLTINIQPGQAPAAGAKPKLCKLHILGNDRPGIVREVSRALKQQQINVVEMSSNITSAPMSGDALFEAHVSAEMPQGCNFDELEESLDTIAEQLSVDIVLS
ncbi:ACT domain-containing protein [Zhongshania sp.]|uniref:glycine cleavage system protein R n=1 Tax=Zhongshania sp. TaxID=1971902 RepID=UPI001B57EAA2|nr:ACT domain-containing protein [Zhongshania sp.]MBQ0794376.1 cellulose-binding protein [Zhongshania sp.]